MSLMNLGCILAVTVAGTIRIRPSRFSGARCKKCRRGILSLPVVASSRRHFFPSLGLDPFVTIFRTFINLHDSLGGRQGIGFGIGHESFLLSMELFLLSLFDDDGYACY